MPELAYVNGMFGPIAEARVSIEDRGFQFGDGVYEVIAAYSGRLFLADAHMQRLRKSTAGIRLDYDFDAKPLEPIIEEGLRRCGFADAMIYIQLTRGAAPRAHEFPKRITPTVIVTFRPLPVTPDRLREHGVRLMTTRETRWANCYIKATTLLPNILAKDEALRRGFDDAIFVAPTGEVRECTSSNLFIAKRGRLTIPPRTESILHGVTQGFLLTCAKSLGIPTAEKAFDVATLLAADEVFMSGTIAEVVGVTHVDGHAIGDGRVGPITRRLHEEFVKRAGHPLTPVA